MFIDYIFPHLSTVETIVEYLFTIFQQNYFVENVENSKLCDEYWCFENVLCGLWKTPPKLPYKLWKTDVIIRKHIRKKDYENIRFIFKRCLE